MMKKMGCKTFIVQLFILLLSTNTVLCQVSSETNLKRLNKKAEEICISTKEKAFCKAFYFYKEKEFDSCYVYSNKALAEAISEDEHDILNYIQGVSAANKILFKKALQNFSAISDNPDFRSLKNLKLGSMYLKLRKHDNAIAYFLKWSNDNANTKKSLKKNGYHNLGLSYLYKKDYTNAKKYFTEEQALITASDTLEVITNKMELANIYYNQYKDDEAIPLFTEAYQLAALFSNLELKQNTTLNLAVVEKNRKNYQKSVAYYIEYGKWKDSIWNRGKIWELAERDKQLAIAQKQQEITLQDEKLKRQNIQHKGLVIGVFGLLIFLSILGYLYKKLTSKNRLITTQKEQLNIANKTKDYLFSVVSHDLRSPMSALKKQHKKLEVQIADKDLLGITKTAHTAVAITEDTSHLLNNVLNWSLEQNNQLVHNQDIYPLTPLIEQTLHNFENLAQVKEITIHTKLDNAILAKTDKESLKIVLQNIFDNAIKYTKEKGSINVKTKITSENYCAIEIEDTGVGISEEKLVKINALKDITIDKIDRSKGVGLGLLLCKTLIKKNNGKLVIESELDRGTLILVLLPNATT